MNSRVPWYCEMLFVFSSVGLPFFFRRRYRFRLIISAIDTILSIKLTKLKVPELYNMYVPVKWHIVPLWQNFIVFVYFAYSGLNSSFKLQYVHCMYVLYTDYIMYNLN